jgi:hypothetical protein
MSFVSRIQLMFGTLQKESEQNGQRDITFIMYISMIYTEYLVCIL